MKKIAIWGFGVIVIIEIAYLILVNAALNLPLTQTLVNQHKPEKYAVTWARAWSWYPFRFQAAGIAADGQTSTQQWQADVPRASASLSVLPLLHRTLEINDLAAEGIEFRIRPRPRPDKDRSLIRDFFPPIRNRDPALPAEPKTRKEGKGWAIAVDGFHARGDHRLWLYQVRGALSGDVRGNATYTTRGGPFALNDGTAKLSVGSLLINDEPAVSEGGIVEGSFQMAPFVPSEHRGKKALAFLTADARVDARVNSVDFLDVYLQRYNGMELDGKGRWKGRLRYQQGDLVRGTDMEVSASELVLNATPYRVEGRGEISIQAETNDLQSLAVNIVFGTLNAFHASSEPALFSGEKLEIGIVGDNRILPDEQRETGRGRVAVTIPKVAVSDLSVYQYLIPEKWPVRLNGGAGELVGQASFAASNLNAELQLVSDDADIAVKDRRFVTNLELGVKANGLGADTRIVDLSGTYLTLDDAQITNSADEKSQPWQASLSISEGALGLPAAEADTPDTGFKTLVAAIKEKQLRNVLETMDADLAAHLSVSHIGWVNLLFRNPFELALSGAGEAEAELAIRSGWLAEGTALRVEPRGLELQVLDYVARGDGLVTLAVQRGGETPDMVLDAALEGGELRRRGEERAVVEDVTLAVSANAENVELGERGTVAAIDLRIPSARVQDMSVYDSYFPDKMPLRLTGGEATLTADVRLEQESAGGFVKLRASDLSGELDEQELAGELSLDINVEDGVPSNMEFDISGSSLRLDGVEVVGDEKTFDQPSWAFQFDFDRAEVTWKKPIRLDVEGRIAMHDSRPLLALLANQRGKYGWIEKLLTVEDVRGKGQLKSANGEITIPYVFAGSDEIDVGAKGVINPTTREGMFYARFRKLQGILKVQNGKRNFDILRAREKFDAYAPGETDIAIGAEE